VGVVEERFVVDDVMGCGVVPITRGFCWGGIGGKEGKRVGGSKRCWSVKGINKGTSSCDPEVSWGGRDE
jgi:hypothetical protein